MNTLNNKLVDIQGRLKAPKNQRNSFGNYNYRSCEDILEALKPLLREHNLRLTITDDTVEIAGMVFIDAEAIISDGTNTVSSRAQAGINLNKKGMDIAQSFGASSSYARKYALNGLFLIDDTKDADSTNNHKGEVESVENGNTKSWLNKNTPQFENAKKAIASGKFTIANIRDKYNVSKEVAELLQK
jgi:hypothetical protein